MLVLFVTAAAGAAADDLTPRQARLFQVTCAACHVRPDTGAPLVGQADAWGSERGLETLLRNTVDGVGRMPPLGGCGACSEADLRALIRFMAGIAEPESTR